MKVLNKSLPLITLLVFLINSNYAISEDEDFHFSSFGQKNLENINLNKLTKKSKIAPGHYEIDIYLNKKFLTQDTVLLYESEYSELTPCLKIQHLSLMNIKPNDIKFKKVADECIDIVNSIPNSTQTIDSSLLKIDVTIPDIYVNSKARGYINPELYDYGINGLKIKYSLNSYYNNINGKFDSFLSLNNTLNYEGWRLKNQSTIILNDRGGNEWNSIRTYAEKEIIGLNSQLSIGENFTSGQFFPSIKFTGVSLKTDQRLLPSSQIGYAPIINGIARSDSKVTIKQNNYVIYEKNVPPGEFLINDLYDTGYAGDLTVIIEDIGGNVQSYTIPYDSSINLVRVNQINYTSTLGKIKNNKGNDPLLGEFTLQYGIHNNITGYGGLQVIDKGSYNSAIIGSAINTKIGSISLDLTRSSSVSSQNNKRINGYSFRATYSKNFNTTGTNFIFNSYRFLSEDYLTLSEHLARKDHNAYEYNYNNNDRVRIQISLNQKLPYNYGSLVASGSYIDKWGQGNDSYNYQLGYTNQVNNISYGVTANQINYLSGKRDNQLSLNISVPLTSIKNTTLSHSIGFSDNDSPDVQLGLSGHNDERNINYHINLDKRQDRSQLNTGLNITTPYNNLGVTYAISNGRSNSIGLNINGGAVIHKGGVVLSSEVGETVGLVYVPNGSGAKVGNNEVNNNGYAITPNLTPYRENDIIVLPGNSPLKLEIKRPVRKVIPTADSINHIKFDTSYGYAVLINTQQSNSIEIPLGSLVYDTENELIGTVGQNNHVFVRVKNLQGTLYIDNGNRILCKIDYTIKDHLKNNLLYLSEPCL
ncbi:fimbria/pilus outer membrane usher protein [Vibrio metschnikovii]|uniref:fimbria/pilus outer membrane usher protein n=1 Tax=Vibrio metschnikovii TaxID=28172 RepID=UPI001C2F8B57|nr:fimbria/pilus outer membrane usher protein [Vibrio metschnikovii]